jgi:glycosyltransferase involved in cell wall biosynthesis
MMKALLKQFGGKNHSWAHTGHHIARSLKSLGNDVHFYSTDGIKHFPTDLQPNLLGYNEEHQQAKVFGTYPSNNYDLQISYTAMKNFSAYFNPAIPKRIGIWCYEWNGKNVLPDGFAKHYKAVSFIAAPSTFAKDVFTNSGIPSDHIRIIPHGVSPEFLSENKEIMKINSEKKFKILVNIAQNHLRKNIPGLLDAYGTAFDKKDDTLLILKVRGRKANGAAEISIDDCLKQFHHKFPNAAEILIFSDFIPDLSSLYNSVDAVFSMSHCEGFNMVALEGLLSGKLNICPRYGGQLDFLNDGNALLVNGKISRADPRSMYWKPSGVAEWFVPDINDAAEKLRLAYRTYRERNEQIEASLPELKEQYSWNAVVSQMIKE